MPTTVNESLTHLTAKNDVSHVFNEVDKDAQKLNQRFKSLDKGSKDVQSRFRNMASTVAVLEGPLGQVAGRINTIGAAAGRMNPALLAFSVTLASLTVGATLAAKAAARREQDMLQFEAQLKATGNASGYTARQLDELALALGRNTLASTTGAREAEGAMLSFRNISGDTFKQLLSYAQDYTAVFKGDLRSNAVKLARALDNPREGLQSLTRQITAFTPQYREMIATMFESGQKIEAQGMIMATLGKMIGGAGEAQGKGLSGQVDTLSENWSRLLETIGQGSGILSAATSLIHTMAEGAQILNDLVASDQQASTEELAKRIRNANELYGERLRVLNKLILEQDKNESDSHRRERLDAMLAFQRARSERDRLLGIQKTRKAEEDAAKVKAGETQAEIAAQDKFDKNSKSREALLNKAKTQQEKYNEKIAEMVRLFKEGAKQGGFTEAQFLKAASSLTVPGQSELDKQSKQDELQKSKLESLKLSLMTEEQALMESYQRREQQLADFYSSGVIPTQDEYFALSQQNHERFLTDWEKSENKHRSAELKLWQESNAGKAQIVASSMSAIAGLLMTGSKKQFEIGKKLALASAVVDTAAAVAKANDNPFPLNALLIAKAIATGLTQINTIRSTTFGSSSGNFGSGGSSVSAQNDLGSTFNQPQLKVPTSNSQNGNVQNNVNINFAVSTVNAAGMAEVIDQHKTTIANAVTSVYREKGMTIGRQS